MGGSRRTFRWEVRETESASSAVKRAIASLEQCAPTDLGVLGDVVEPDDLNDLVGSSSGPADEPDSLSFRYCGYDVLVRPEGYIHVRK